MLANVPKSIVVSLDGAMIAEIYGRASLISGRKRYLRDSKNTRFGDRGSLHILLIQTYM